MAVIAANPGHGLVGAGRTAHKPGDTALVRRDPARPMAAFPVPAPAFECPEPCEALGDARLRAALPSGPPMDCATLICEREAMLAVGGYRPALGHAAGYDLLLRLSSHTRMAKLAEPLVSRTRPLAHDESQIVIRAHQTAVAWLCHRERLAGRADAVEAMGRLPTADEMDLFFGRGAGDVVRRRVIEASFHAPQALAREGWDMLKSYARRHHDDPRMWRLAARMLAAGKPVRASQLGMALISS